MMMALDSAQVRSAFVQNFASRSQERAAQYAILGNGHSAKLGWHAQDYNVQGAMGDARLASADKGEKLLAQAGQGLREMLLELIRMPLASLSTEE